VAALKPVALITGASAGLGLQLARVFASHGHELALVARRASELNRLADELAAEGKPKPLVVPADLTRSDAGAYVAGELRAHGREPSFVVNNAGFGMMGPAARLDRAEQLAMIDLNARALTDLSLRFIDSLARHRGGILNVASVASFVPGPGIAVYFATKAYVLSFSEALHHELKPKGIRVTALCPGPVATEFQARAGMPMDYFPSALHADAASVARYGYAALLAGRRVAIPGYASRISAFLPRLAPRTAVLSLMNRFRRRWERRHGGGSN
jgi:short-subunit dehydrogenase